MKFLQTIVKLLVAGAFAVGEAVLYVDELRVARVWRRKQHS